jgi:hypothetical protein
MATRSQPLERVKRSPGDFAAALATDEPVLLVGGQAVNLWALHYHRRTACLEPFLSQDADVLGTRKTLLHIARNVGAKPQFFPMRPPTNEIGVVIAAGADGQPLAIEVLSHVHGITNEELCQPTYTMLIGNDMRVLVPGPIALLQCKMANVADLNQDTRQDSRHVRILARLMPAYLADLHESVAAGRINERGMLDLLERLLAAIITRKARKTLQNLEISGLEMFAELEARPASKLHSFLTRRIPRALPRLDKPNQCGS